ncbi:DNA-binding GntR family transcriptional regulator [Crossiella equi]|uniref:DNA-binding GntR family transcriptional regulator n=1 Tax=Crossiella equi TaxID=130796 RepID=A0ABS5A7H3_9PSEU|nr:GntR family transcriptional regulator [Crossiella equi]MBP2472543.1 DNA-binding GntR family transcriptional regulator [Crossiella equi]
MTDDLLAALRTDTLADRAYKSIRDAIVTGQLRAGEKVTERGLAEQLSVSPTPVREAIRRLEQDGLLERKGPRTVVVTGVGEVAQRDLAEVELGLRGMVARFAARHATQAQLDALDAILDEADDLVIVVVQRRQAGEVPERQINQLLDRMRQFNDALEACAGNPVLSRLLDQVRVFSHAERRARRLARITEDPTFGLDRYASHRELVRALRAGDAARAESVFVEDARGGLGDLLYSPQESATS